MRASLFALAAAVASASAQQTGTLPLGSECQSTDQCAYGAQCFASTSMQIKQCGKYNAACESNTQCATNTCSEGLCKGVRPPTVTARDDSTSAAGMSAAPSSTVVAADGTVPLGSECASDEQCANGAQCFASTAWQIKSCGKFNAACQTDDQCASNTCSGGLCRGPLATSSVQQARRAESSASATEGMQSAPSSTIVAQDGSLPLGSECASDVQCANGAQCFASTAWQIKSCGKFNAACETDDQCASNTCSGGLCRGPLATSTTTYLKPSYPRGTGTSTGNSTTGVVSNGTGSASTPSQSVFAGAASQAGVGAGVAIAALGFAFALLM